MIRRTIVVLLALLAISTVAAPALLGRSDRDRYDDAIGEILVDDTLNNGRAEGAPQQQVVNGWTARDLLALQSAQQNDALEMQSRQMILLLMIAVLIAWGVVTASATSAATPPFGSAHSAEAERAGTPTTIPRAASGPGTGGHDST